VTDIDLEIPPFLQRAAQMKTIENGATPNGNGHVAVREPAAALTPMDMVRQALTQGAPMEVVERFMAMHERFEASQARKVFNLAIAQAKAEITPIVKNAVGHNNKKYADFSGIARAVDPIITKFGLSYRFRTTQSERISVTCVLSHELGHSEENTLSGPADKTGSKNDIQAIGSTLTYLQRYSLVQALGLAAANDDDGNGGRGGNGNGGATITDAQVDEINKLLIETKSNLVLFLRRIKLESLTEIRADKFAEVMTLIRDNAKRREQQS
jgi:ERF superfamily